MVNYHIIALHTAKTDGTAKAIANYSSVQYAIISDALSIALRSCRIFQIPNVST